jgi:hypothetical protein
MVKGRIRYKTFQSLELKATVMHTHALTGGRGVAFFWRSGDGDVAGFPMEAIALSQ